MRDADDATAATAATAAEPSSPRRDPGPGDSIGKYRLDRIIGSGGMGVVWQAFDPDLERAIALKVLHSPDGEPTLRTRLLREARAMARLKHPNVVTVYEVGTDRNRDYIAMELVEGDNLDHWLGTKPPRAEILDALFAAARGLAAAHDAGLVHRDFKPHNVLRSHDGHIFVTDFGLARGSIDNDDEIAQLPLVAAGSGVRRPHDSVLDTPLTQTGVLIGTPAYMAPEQFTGRAPDHRTDQFAFCVTAWEALSGARPFGGTSLTELESSVGVGVTALSIGAPELPPRLRAVLTRGLAPEPADRWPDLRALVRALEDALRPQPRRRRWIVGLVGLVAVGAGTAFFVTRGGSSGSVAAAADACDAPDRAFAMAWSPDRRADIVRVRSLQGLVGSFAMLDELELMWTKSLKGACTVRPQTVASRERIACLIALRDRLGATTSRMTDPGYTPEKERLFPIGELLRCDGIPQKIQFVVPGVPEVPEVPNVEPPEPPEPPDKLELEIKPPE